MIGAFILGHYKEREKNLPKIVKALREGKDEPDEIFVFIDNPEIKFDDDSVHILRSNKPLPVIRKFALALVSEMDECFFIDDDMLPGRLTLSTYLAYRQAYPDAIIGYDGVRLADTKAPYTDGVEISHAKHAREVDILLRSYLAPVRVLSASLFLRSNNNLKERSLDDILMSLGNKFMLGNENIVVPLDEYSRYKELPHHKTGLSQEPGHYEDRNRACLTLLNNYAKS